MYINILPFLLFVVNTGCSTATNSIDEKTKVCFKSVDRQVIDECTDEQCRNVSRAGSILLLSTRACLNMLHAEMLWIRKYLLGKEPGIRTAKCPSSEERSIVDTLMTDDVRRDIDGMKHGFKMLARNVLDGTANVTGNETEIHLSLFDIKLLKYPLADMANILLMIAYFADDSNTAEEYDSNRRGRIASTMSKFPEITSYCKFHKENYEQHYLRTAKTWPEKATHFIDQLKKSQHVQHVLVERGRFRRLMNELKEFYAGMHSILNDIMAVIDRFVALLNNKKTTNVDIFRFTGFTNIVIDPAHKMKDMETAAGIAEIVACSTRAGRTASTVQIDKDALVTQTDEATSTAQANKAASTAQTDEVSLVTQADGTASTAQTDEVVSTAQIDKDASIARTDEISLVAQTDKTAITAQTNSTFPIVQTDKASLTVQTDKTTSVKQNGSTATVAQAGSTEESVDKHASKTGQDISKDIKRQTSTANDSNQHKERPACPNGHTDDMASITEGSWSSFIFVMIVVVCILIVIAVYFYKRYTSWQLSM